MTTVLIQKTVPTPEDEERHKRQALKVEVVAGFVYLAVFLPLLNWLRVEAGLIDRFVPLRKVFTHPLLVAYVVAFAALLVYIVRKRVPYLFGYVEVLIGSVLISAAAQKAAEAADHITDVFILSAISGIFLCVRGCEKIHEHAANARIQLVTLDHVKAAMPELHAAIIKREQDRSAR